MLGWDRDIIKGGEKSFERNRLVGGGMEEDVSKECNLAGSRGIRCPEPLVYGVDSPSLCMPIPGYSGLGSVHMTHSVFSPSFFIPVRYHSFKIAKIILIHNDSFTDKTLISNIVIKEPQRLVKGNGWENPS
ncbi:hypothetical protein TNCV_3910131 [Trichonephila clavipes]|nr:hypothetical protein TNCV_3910131 [Trichonephila clavipes]